MRRLPFGILALGLLGLPLPGFAADYLVGALVYASGSNGANVGAYSGAPYKF